MTALQFLYWILGVTQLCWLDSNQQFLTNYTIQLIQKHFELVKEIETDKPLFEEAEKVSIYFNFGYKSRFVLVNDDLEEIQSSILKLT